jgi:uncharacterized protein YhdP
MHGFVVKMTKGSLQEQPDDQNADGSIRLAGVFRQHSPLRIPRTFSAVALAIALWTFYYSLGLDDREDLQD